MSSIGTARIPKMKPASASALLAIGLLLAACGTAPEPTATAPSVPLVGNYPAPAAEKSGRAAVQHGYDPGAASLDRTPQKITVEQLVSMRRKVGDDIELSNFPDKRVAPFETSTYQIDATIKSIKHEKDGDFYCVIQGDSGAQAVVEVPDPRVCKDSPMLPDIEKAREALYNKFHPTDTNRAVNEKATITGVGYLGTRKRKGSGTFSATARLMPGTGVTFPAGQ